MGTTYSIIERIKVKYEVSLRAGGHLRRFRRRKPRALSYYSDLTLSQSFQPMAAQLSKKSALPLAKILATASCHNSKTGPRVEFAWLNAEWTYGDQDNSSETIMPKYFASCTLSRICRQIISHIFELESFWLRILGNSACLQNNSSQIWDGITKFAPSMHIHWDTFVCYWKWRSLTLTFKVILAILT